MYEGGGEGVVFPPKELGKNLKEGEQVGFYSEEMVGQLRKRRRLLCWSMYLYYIISLRFG